MSRLKVAVLRGGASYAYDASLATGGNILANLDEERYQPLDILVTKDGEWHHRGLPTSAARVGRLADVVVNGLHGSYGEDGRVQKVLDALGVPYTGSSAVPSAVAMHKAVAKNYLRAHGVKTPLHATIAVTHDLDRRILEIFRSFPQPSVVKPVTANLSVGVAVAHTFEEFDRGVRDAFRYAPTVLVEEYVRGKEVTCGVIDDFRGKDTYALFPTEVVPPPGKRFFDYEAKRGGTAERLCPGRLSRAEKETIQELARLAHRVLGLRHYSRSDFVVSPRGIYFLEINTLPELSPDALVPQALAAGGATLPEFLDHIINLAVRER